MRIETRTHGWLALSLLPMACAMLGAVLDERGHLGFSNWRSACRAAGLSLPSLVTFTFELLPTALVGALSGGFIVLVIGASQRRQRSMAVGSLAAHGGCVIGMCVGLPLCVLPFPLPWLMGTEALLAVGCATLLYRLLARRHCSTSGIPRTRQVPSA